MSGDVNITIVGNLVADPELRIRSAQERARARERKQQAAA